MDYRKVITDEEVKQLQERNKERVQETIKQMASSWCCHSSHRVERKKK